MEALKELVAASFARHGIVCPEADSQFPQSIQPVLDEKIRDQPSRAAEPLLTSALPEHNFRKSLQGDPAP